MRSSSEEKLDAIHMTVMGMKPQLDFAVDGIKSIDARLRSAEIKVVQHDVEVKQLENNIAGLWRKMRKNRGDGEGRWHGIAEFITALPAVWHIATALILAILGIMGIAVVRHPANTMGADHEKADVIFGRVDGVHRTR